MLRSKRSGKSYTTSETFSVEATALPNQHLTGHIYETFKLPISEAVADFNISPHGDGTDLTIHYSYTLNRLGRIAKGYTDKQMRKGIAGMTKGLQEESERLETAK